MFRLSQKNQLNGNNCKSESGWNSDETHHIQTLFQIQEKNHI